MYSIFNLPKFEVIVWIKLTSNYQRMEAMLLSTAETIPFQSVEVNDVKDYHWGFESSEEALRFVEKLKKISEDPEIILLRYTSHENLSNSFTIKDMRRITH